jgi:hypothetical protein
VKLEFSRQIFEKKKPTHIKLRENPSSESRVVQYGRTDMKTIIVAFANLRTRVKLGKQAVAAPFRSLFNLEVSILNAMKLQFRKNR